MTRPVALLVVFALWRCEAREFVGEPQQAAILQEQRYLAGDGAFGAAYSQEDGIDFQEESNAAGDRRGSYSYLDPTGRRRTVHYTAGRDGFRATGDDVPSAPVAPPQPQPPRQHAPQHSPRAPLSRAPLSPADGDDGQYYPELYEREDTSVSAPQPLPPAREPAPTANHIYPGVSPTPTANHIYPGVSRAQYSGLPTGGAPLAPRPAARTLTTPPPHRFFPPGKFSLDRSPDGFFYTFSNQ